MLDNCHYWIELHTYDQEESMTENRRHGARQQPAALDIYWIQELISSPFWSELNLAQQRLWLRKLDALKTEKMNS
jgi:hypothetical protein